MSCSGANESIVARFLFCVRNCLTRTRRLVHLGIFLMGFIGKNLSQSKTGIDFQFFPFSNGHDPFDHSFC